MRTLLLIAALAITGPLGAREQLRLPWVFSDEPDLNADFGFSPGPGALTEVCLDLGGRFAGFGLAKGAARAPQLDIEAEFISPGTLEAEPLKASTKVDLGLALAEYGETFARKHFDSGSSKVYKAQMTVNLAPGDYNVSISLRDEGLNIDSHRTLHLIVPALDRDHWALGDLKFITAVGKRLNAKGKEERVLDPNPWRQVGGKLGWDLMVAFNDQGQRPAGKLLRRYSVQRLRGDQVAIWEEEGEAADKKAQQVWILRVPEPKLKDWPAGTYLLRVELSVGRQKAESSKTFEVLP